MLTEHSFRSCYGSGSKYMVRWLSSPVPWSYNAGVSSLVTADQTVTCSLT